jgi:hypothetical protein
MNKSTFLFLATLALLLAQPFALAQRLNIGYASGTGGVDAVYVGPYAGQNNTQSGNSIFGWAAGQFSGGSQNVYVGFFAGYWNSSIRNTFVGYNAGSRQGSSGSNNTFLGWQTGATVSSGAFNTFVGSSAGSGSNTGSYNTFLGMGAGQRNNASFNTFVGFGSGNFNTGGTRNTYLGTYSGGLGSGGSDNTFVGNETGFNTTGNVNTFVGTQAGRTNSSGHSNAFLGYQAGYNNTNGYYNTFLGVYAGRSNQTGVANTFVGYYAGYYNTGSNNNFLGHYAGYGNSTGTGNVFLGYQAGMSNATGGSNTMLGQYANVASGALTNATAIGSRARVSASNSLVLGSINGVNGATADAKVGIRTQAPAYNLHVNGTAAKPGGGSWTVASDKRLKQEITDYQEGLAAIVRIRPVWFRYNGKADLPTDRKYVGVIAQDMQQIAPYTVGEFIYVDSTGKQEKYLDYDANALSYMLVNAVQEIDEKYTAQLGEKDAQLAGLQQQITALRQEIAAMKSLLNLSPGNDSGQHPSAARLWQNQPNPAKGTTVIRYYLPQDVAAAQLKVYTLDGREVHSVTLPQRGEGQVQLSAREFAAGLYVYHLFADGQSVASKKLVLTK